MVVDIIILVILALYFFVWAEIGLLRFKRYKLDESFMRVIAAHALTGMVVYVLCLTLWFLPVRFHMWMSGEKILSKINMVFNTP